MGFTYSIKVTWHVEMLMPDLHSVLEEISQQFGIGFTLTGGMAIYDGQLQGATSQITHVIPRHAHSTFKDIEMYSRLLAEGVQNAIRARTDQHCTMPTIEAAEYLCTCDTRPESKTEDLTAELLRRAQTTRDSHKGQVAGQGAYR